MLVVLNWIMAWWGWEYFIFVKDGRNSLDGLRLRMLIGWIDGFLPSLLISFYLRACLLMRMGSISIIRSLWACISCYAFICFETLFISVSWDSSCIVHVNAYRKPFSYQISDARIYFSYAWKYQSNCWSIWHHYYL